MSRKREQRLRRRYHRLLRAFERERAVDAAFRPIAVAAIRYVDEIYGPNLKEPFSISNRRMDLVEVVRAYQARHRARRAA